MTERCLIKIQLLFAEEHSGGWPTTNLKKFIAWAENILRHVPEEYQDKVEIDVDSYMDYDVDTLITQKSTYYNDDI